ncbi:hypothetical protein L3X38_014992 [Prunus dulcis]|uniref:Nop domain-containing protein n=1 Tax=Prunus dulcis TaxID=3755 RepID=A0AAD4WPU2_PRUDU|nr:hypothetical protein L3X38_014992 [Prunus dulcis]
MGTEVSELDVINIKQLCDQLLFSVIACRTLPGSTVQILGAEKALFFRAPKTKHATPKYGLVKQRQSSRVKYAGHLQH